MDALRERLVAVQTQATNTDWMERFKRYRNLTELDRTAIVHIIERILVFDDNNVEVIYLWQDALSWQMEILQQIQRKEAV